MLKEILGEEEYCDMMRIHLQDMIDYLLSRGINFSILLNVENVKFDPPLPDEIVNTFKPMTMFIIAGYTFESTILESDKLVFEAGFGPNNFGSFVSVPLLSILQIIVEETPIFINLSITSKEQEMKQKEVGVKKSMEALLSNPENKKLFKK
ncbi:MAG: hypothetical protein R3331_04750 [Sulfurospirillaceae bacterium]|nr:hypothetical protein [Sulfurospirillaceae bacterium]